MKDYSTLHKGLQRDMQNGKSILDLLPLYFPTNAEESIRDYVFWANDHCAYTDRTAIDAMAACIALEMQSVPEDFHEITAMAAAVAWICESYSTNHEGGGTPIILINQALKRLPQLFMEWKPIGK